MRKAESFDLHTQTIKLKLQINSYTCVKWHSHKQNDRHKCVRHIYFCTSVSLFKPQVGAYNLSDLAVQVQILAL